MVQFRYNLWKANRDNIFYINTVSKNALDSCYRSTAEPVLVSQHKILETFNPYGVKQQNIRNQILGIANIDVNGNDKNRDDLETKYNQEDENKREKNVDEEKKNPDEKSNELSDLLADFTAKDKGYAWIVLAAMFFSNMMTFGYVKSFGIIYNAIADMNPDISATMAGLMMGLLSGFKNILAPLAGAMGNLIGIRLTMFIGTFISCAALIGAFFCKTPLQYAIILGAITGFSQCVIESCQVVIMANYFEKRLSFANGIRVAGNPFGGVVYPLLLTFLLEHYGLKLSFIMLAGVTAQLFVFASLVRPFNLHLRIEGIQFIKRSLDKRFLTTEKNQQSGDCSNDSRKQLQRKMLDELASKGTCATNKKKKPLDISFLKKPVYLLFILMSIGIPLACPLVYYYATIYAKDVLNLSAYQVSAFVGVQSVVDVVMRLAIGALNNKKWYKMAHGYIFCLFVSGIGSLCIPMATGFWSLLSCTFIFSFGPNSFHTFVNVILSNQFGKESIASTWGFVRMTQGIFSFVHPTLLGYIIDVSGGYTAAFVTMGLGMLFAGLMILIEPFVIRITNSKVVIT